MKRRLFATLLITCAAAPLLAQAQAERVARPQGPAAAISDPTYLEAYVTPDPDGPTLHCKGPGIDCVVFPKLMEARRPTASHDQPLMQATAAINRILGSLTPPPGKKLCIYRSNSGPLLVWAVHHGREPLRAGDAVPETAAVGRAERRPRLAATHVNAKAEKDRLLGVGAAPRAKPTLKAKIWWNPDTGNSFFHCPEAGSDCVIHGKFAEAARSPSHDEVLAGATVQINRILDQAAAKAPRPDQELCLLFTPDGPMLAWTSKSAPPAGGRLIDSDSPEFLRLARQTLGLAQ